MLTVSIVIPLYNKRDQVDRAMRSVLCQSKPFDEILVIDDCSTDGSPEIVEQLIETFPSAPIRLIRHDSNRGPGAARNTGLAAFSSDYVCFLDADDYLERDFLENVMTDFSAKESTGVVIYCVKEQGSGIVRPHLGRLQTWSQQLPSGRLLLTNWASAMVAEPLFCSGGNVLMAQSFAKHTRFDETARNFEDWDFYFRVCQAAIQSEKTIEVSKIVGLTYSDEDPNSLSRAKALSPHLLKLPPAVANDMLPVEIRKFTCGIWLCHVAQRAPLLQALRLVFSAAIHKSSMRPTMAHLAAALFSACAGTVGWQIVSRLRKHFRYA